MLLASVRPEHKRLLARAGTVDALDQERHVLPDLGAAVEHARLHVRHRDRAMAAA